MNDPIKAEQDAVTYREAVNNHGIEVIKPHKEMPTPRGFETYRNDRTPYGDN